MRADLPPGLVAAQVCHAAGQSARLAQGAQADLQHAHAVILAAPSEDALRALAGRLERAGLAFSAVVEDDAEPAQLNQYRGQMMAIGLAPAPREALRRPLSSLPLYRKE